MSKSNRDASRYAIYFSPGAGSPLLALGNRWLGRDATTGEALNPDLPAHIRHENWMRATDSPRRYGFHATLKPPFYLAEDASLKDLQAALRVFAQSHSSFYAPPPVVGALGRFLALILSAHCEQFSNLAAACVSEFDRFRAPATEEETAARLRGPLTVREREHVMKWGYPYVFDTWKFHMSLTSSLHNGSLSLFEPYLRQRFAPACEQSILVDSICIFREPSPGALFRLLDSASLRSI